MRTIITMLLLFVTIAVFSQEPQTGTVIDTRDGKTYSTVIINGVEWMSQNLNYGTMGVEKFCYNNLETNCDLYGGLYNWDKAMGNATAEGSQGICPSGWHIPTKGEIEQLYDDWGGIMVAGAKLKKSIVWEPYASHTNPPSTNETGFTATFTGTRFSTGAYKYLNSAGMYWTSSSEPQWYGAYWFGVGYYQANAKLGQVYSNHPDYGSQAVGIRCKKQ